MRSRAAKKNTLSLTILTVVFAATFTAFVSVNTQTANAQVLNLTVDDDGPADFSSIQAAINAASPGATINVRSGRYSEHIVVNQTQLSILGENNTTTIINATGQGAGISVLANATTIAGFRIENAGLGSLPSNGIDLISSSNTITGNVMTANHNHGLLVNNSDSNTISDNRVIGNYWCGIVFRNSDHNTIYDNYVAENLQQNDGVGLIFQDGSDFNLIENNTITGNDGGIGFVHFSLTVSSNDNIVRNNNISDNIEDGIFLYDFGQRNLIAFNKIIHNGGGVHLSSLPQYNTIAGNNISLNTYGGIGLENAPFNVIYHNNLVGNTPQVWYKSTDTSWDNGYPTGGNYWSDYTGTDTNHDGIGDTPYTIDSNNQDRYPLMAPFETQAITVQPSASLSAEPNPVGVGQTAKITMKIAPLPRTSSSFSGLLLRITKPDGTVETKGPYVLDTSGSLNVSYVPTLVGNYSLKVDYPGQFFAIINSTYLPASSTPLSLRVQQQPVFSGSPSPTPTATPRPLLPTPTPSPHPTNTPKPTSTPTPTPKPTPTPSFILQQGVQPTQKPSFPILTVAAIAVAVIIIAVAGIMVWKSRSKA